MMQLCNKFLADRIFLNFRFIINSEDNMLKKYMSLKRSVLNGKLIVKLIAYLFILLFLYAAANKLLDFQKFKVQLGQSPILTEYATPIAFLIPAIEILLAPIVFFEKSRLAGLYGCFSLMVMFSAYIVVVTRFAERVPCSCGGILEAMDWGEHLVFNLVFVIMGIIGIVLQTRITENKKREDMVFI